MGEHQEEIALLLDGRADVLAVRVPVAGEHIAQHRLSHRLMVASRIQCDPLGKRMLRGFKIVSAERCATSLSRGGIEPGAAPLRAVGPPAEEEVSDAELGLALSRHARTSPAVKYSARCVSV
ncbi:hypothetical protein [Muricoccus radiodurans]|uniref:hypothetical protein n=1 Tax=Muricoccus radiodurans TaxID=2231721 RepID=UPI003CEE68E5